jgi:hypothetical protein
MLIWYGATPISERSYEAMEEKGRASELVVGLCLKCSGKQSFILCCCPVWLTDLVAHH